MNMKFTVIASEAKQSPGTGIIAWRLLRRCAPRNVGTIKDSQTIRDDYGKHVT
jgi:hypothetical protein